MRKLRKPIRSLLTYVLLGSCTTLHRTFVRNAHRILRNTISPIMVNCSEPETWDHDYVVYHARFTMESATNADINVK
ncbi:hypothetical protein C8Q80DRAFT_475735 [Daedaleopsis nitida]|nr:hypothetical protein C8Q80DRAFT_475735 [Daedaleopsis nitida]